MLDLAKGHLLALDALAPESKAFDDCPSEARYKAYNLGRGQGMSVLQIVEAMRKATEEVDEILGDEPIRLEHIGKLKYISGAYLRLCTPCASVPLCLCSSGTP